MQGSTFKQSALKMPKQFVGLESINIEVRTQKDS